MDSEMSSDFKLDLVEKLFAIDTEPKTPFNTQVRIPGHTALAHHESFIPVRVLCFIKPFLFPSGDGGLGSGDVGPLHPYG